MIFCNTIPFYRDFYKLSSFNIADICFIVRFIVEKSVPVIPAFNPAVKESRV